MLLRLDTIACIRPSYVALDSVFWVSVADGENEADCEPKLEPNLVKDEQHQEKPDRLVDVVARHL